MFILGRVNQQKVQSAIPSRCIAVGRPLLLAMKKRARSCLGYIGDDKGIIIGIMINPIIQGIILHNYVKNYNKPS